MCVWVCVCVCVTEADLTNTERRNGLREEIAILEEKEQCKYRVLKSYFCKIRACY
jgi:hypothetical protein